MKRIYLTLALFLFGFVLTAQKLPFQGYLEESGVPVNGIRTFDFALPDYGWTETKTDIPIDNGIYNVVFGDETPLPSMIFSDTTETPLEITVNGVSIGIATLYKPLVNINSLLTTDGNLEIKGPNDSLNLRVGSFNPYYGSVNLYDSLGASQGFLAADPLGGRLQLNQRNGSGALTSAIVARTNGSKSYSQYYGSNPSGTGIARLMENYITEREIAGGPEMSGGYLRSGSDWYDNEGTLLAAIGNAREEGGSDPTGKSGFLSLWGTNSFNAQLTGKRWENNDLPILQLFGRNDDGNSWWQSNAVLDVVAGPGTSTFGNMALYTTDNGGENNQSVFISSNLFGSSAGGMELRDSLGITTAILEARGNGNSGQLKLRGTNGLDIAAVQNRGGNSGQAVFYGNDSGLKAEVGAFGDNSGFLITYGPNGNKNVQLDRDPGNNDLGQFTLFGTDGISPRVFATTGTDGTNEWGSITLDSPTEQIVLNGQTSTITATTITASSDRRLKKNITNLENSLENTLKLRGTSYFWKNENGSKKRQIGVIAQEVEEIYPEFVYTNVEGFKSVNYAQMTAVLIEAIKELNAKVESLEKENDALTTALNETKELSKKIDKLEKLLLEGQKVASK